MIKQYQNHEKAIDIDAICVVGDDVGACAGNNQYIDRNYTGC